MNGSELSKTTLGDNTSVFADDEAIADQRELERWASEIAGCLQQVTPAAPATVGLFGAGQRQEVPAGWRPCVESMTHGGASMVGGPLASNGPDSNALGPSSELGRIQVRVRTEEFGEIALVVERVEEGLRVLLGAVDAHTVTALTRESQAVRRVLEFGGQTVGSIKIVRMNELGTDLAQSKLAPSNRARRPQESAETATVLSEHKKKTKRIDLIG